MLFDQVFLSGSVRAFPDQVIANALRRGIPEFRQRLIQTWHRGRLIGHDDVVNRSGCKSRSQPQRSRAGSADSFKDTVKPFVMRNRQVAMATIQGETIDKVNARGRLPGDLGVRED
jgi:hypothetical protein